MHRVIAHIDARLDQPLDLPSLAEVAHFSPFHFHRLFAAWMGETLGEYLRRRRLEVAATRLAAQPRMTVLDVALSVGFGSAEAFARAFKGRFGCAPSVWRIRQVALRCANSNPGQVDRNLNQASVTCSADHDVSPMSDRKTIMNVRLIDRQPVTVAYLRHLGPYGEAIERFWQNAFQPWAATNDLLQQARYGISYDDPSITAPAQCRYDACVEVAADFVVSGGARRTTIPGGKYAAVHYRGTGARIGDAWTALLRDWLPDSGLQLDARPCFEYYPVDGRYDPQTGEFECEICVPVASR